MRLNFTGYVIWQSNDLVCVMTVETENPKTGPMFQTWILSKHAPPHELVKTKLDHVVCGVCPMRAGQGCYVNAWQAPLAVYTAWLNDSYPTLQAGSLAHMVKGQMVRIGAYGDPYFVPVSIWEIITANASGWTGYTHQWRAPNAMALVNIIMASCDSVTDQIEAVANGWRTFRTVPKGGVKLVDEIVCPNESHDKKCADCGLCCGASMSARNIIITAHGSKAHLVG